MEETKDYMVRATAGGGAIRAFAATTRHLAEYARSVHGTSPVVTAALGRLLTAGAMMGTMMKGEKDLLTLRIQGDGPVKSLLVTAESDGYVRGYAANPHVDIPCKWKGKLDVGGAVGKGILSVIRDVGLKDPYVGQVDLVSGEIAEDLTYYFAVSEQVPSSVALGVLVDTDCTVKQAGGFILQLMPDAPEDVIGRLEQKLAEIPSVTEMLEAGKTPEDILTEVLDGLSPEILEKVPVGYRCTCTRDRVERALISISSKDLKEMMKEGKDIEVGCQFCDKKYTFTAEDLKRMYVQKSVAKLKDWNVL
jgi:molecular chaperone Hsp33